MKKFLSSRRNRIGLVIVTIASILLGIGAFVGYSLWQRSSEEQSNNGNDEITQEEQGGTNKPPPVPASAPSSSIKTIPTFSPTYYIRTITSSSTGPTVSSSDITTTETTPSSMVSNANSSSSISSDPPTYVDTYADSTVGEGNANFTTFYAIGDVPYTEQQHLELASQIFSIPEDAEFVIHVGDMRKSGKNIVCEESEYSEVAATLRTSKAPVFIVIGDNDWNDCPNADEGLMYWQQEFSHFDSRYWNHTFNVSYQPNRPDNFAFIHKSTLFMGFNLVGGTPLDQTEWSERLSDQADWAIQQILLLLTFSQPRIPRVVIFGHANPKPNHEKFFQPITQFIQTTLQNTVPVLYLCGDRHRWLHQTDYFDQPSFTRIMLTGKTFDPPLKVMVNSNGVFDTKAFMYDRMLPPGHPALNGTRLYDDDEYQDNADDDLFTTITDDVYVVAQTSGNYNL